MNELLMTRIWAMPSKDTFSIPPIAGLVKQYLTDNGVWLDPFCGKSPFKDYGCMTTNDLNPDIDANEHLEATEFLKLFKDNSVDGVIFDPPYSPRQIKECYDGIGLKVHQRDVQHGRYNPTKKEIARVLKKNGIVISCGWNTNGMANKILFKLVEILLVPHGGAHNDTIVTVEIRRGCKQVGLLL